ncbi:hypothetical protein NO2_1136, partial [Candidatus Termititenax persephonae]
EDKKDGVTYSLAVDDTITTITMTGLAADGKIISGTLLYTDQIGPEGQKLEPKPDNNPANLVNYLRNKYGEEIDISALNPTESAKNKNKWLIPAGGFSITPPPPTVGTIPVNEEDIRILTGKNREEVFQAIQANYGSALPQYTKEELEAMLYGEAKAGDKNYLTQALIDEFEKSKQAVRTANEGELLAAGIAQESITQELSEGTLSESDLGTVIQQHIPPKAEGSVTLGLGGIPRPLNLPRPELELAAAR